MKTFKQYLQEAAVGAQPQFTSVDVKEAIDMLNKHARDSLWMLHEDTPFYRGDDAALRMSAATGFSHVDTNLTTRKSENTSNYYTVILDNHPDRPHFPKRSKSLICSTTESDAEDYSYTGPVIVIPFDSAKIGVVNKPDMWDTIISMFDGHTVDNSRIHHVNNVFQQMGIDATIESFKKFDADLKAGEPATVGKFEDAFGSAALKYKDKFLEGIWDAYSENATDHRAFTPATLPHKLGHTEVWVQGKVMLITAPMWDSMRGALYND